MDWNRRRCARRGHVFYEPLEPEFLARAKAETPLGPAWRCLRCGDYTLAEAMRKKRRNTGSADGQAVCPVPQGPVADAPDVPRGKALRQLTIMRLLACERIFRFLLAGAAAYAVWKFANSEQALSDLFDRNLTVLRPVATHYGYDLDHSAVVSTIEKLFNYKHSTLVLAACALGAYSAVELVEAFGLWTAKRWGEYFAVVATSVFIPVEVHELLDKTTAFNVATFALNILAVLYLILAKRLFGVRGGGVAAEAELRGGRLLDSNDVQAPATEASAQAATLVTAVPGARPASLRAPFEEREGSSTDPALTGTGRQDAGPDVQTPTT
ncbi:MAG TPA: DUF2127 domain-containing protein [Actinocrinis sp.]|jgi:uncharacterized membrane protein (DUF2068 family)